MPRLITANTGATLAAQSGSFSSAKDAALAEKELEENISAVAGGAISVMSQLEINEIGHAKILFKH